MANPETVTLRVKEHIPLPHIIRRKGVQYIFNPDETLPKDYAESLLKSNPNAYEVAKGKPDLSKYAQRPTWTRATLVDLVDSLDAEGQKDFIAWMDEYREKKTQRDQKKAEAEEKARLKVIKDREEEEQKARAKAERDAKNKEE